MKKYLILIVFFSLVQIGQAQGNLKVSYKTSITINLDTLKGPSNFKQPFKNSIDKSELLNFNLDVNIQDSLSVFSKIDLVDNSVTKLDLNILDLLIDVNGKYFTSKTKLIHNYYILDKNLKVKVAEPVKWTLVNEKRKIDKYECFKAKGKIQYGKNKGDTVEAWYTKSIPIPYGPKIYYGLLGLILEVKDENNIFYVDKIEFAEKDFNIKKPKTNEIISERQAEIILAEINKKAEDYLKN
jgi:GLPGLI family protein